MKHQKGFDWFKVATTSMFVIGLIGIVFYLSSLIFPRIVFREPSSTNAVKINSDPIKDSSQFLQKDQSSEGKAAIYQDAEAQEDAMPIDEAIAWLELLDNDQLPKSGAVVSDDTAQKTLKEQETDELGLTLEEREQIVADVVQKLYEVVEEYRSIDAESDDLLKMPSSPEIGKRWNELKQKKIDLMPHVVDLVWQYLLYTKDTAASNPGGKIAQAIEGIMEVELGTNPDGRPIIATIYPNF